MSANEFRFTAYPFEWRGGEPRVFAVSTEDEFPLAHHIEGARIVSVRYAGGGLRSLFNLIADAADIPSNGSFQALLENLEHLSESKPLILFVQSGDRLLADVGPALLHVTTFWERFARHAGGVSAMYLVLETGPRGTTDAAFHPGGKVDWL
jgi:hypothetical protein